MGSSGAASEHEARERHQLPKVAFVLGAARHLASKYEVNLCMLMRSCRAQQGGTTAMIIATRYAASTSALLLFLLPIATVAATR